VAIIVAIVVAVIAQTRLNRLDAASATARPLTAGEVAP
jgi:hypothetical protein